MPEVLKKLLKNLSKKVRMRRFWKIFLLRKSIRSIEKLLEVCRKRYVCADYEKFFCCARVLIRSIEKLLERCRKRFSMKDLLVKAFIGKFRKTRGFLCIFLSLFASIPRGFLVLKCLLETIHRKSMGSCYEGITHHKCSSTPIQLDGLLL